MTKFLLQYYSPSLAALQGRLEQQIEATAWEFKFSGISNIRLILRDYVEDSDGIQLHLGLLITISMEATGIEEALELAKTVTESILNSITLSSLAFCGAAQLVGYVDLTNNKIRSLGYPFGERKNPLGSLALLKEKEFREIFDKYDQAPEKKRLMRALSWLRKGINDENAIDEFVSYWVGLEVLRGVLRRQLKMKAKDPSEWQAIQEIFNNLPAGKFDKVLDARNALLHGFRELSNDFIEEIKTYIDPTRKALITAIGEVLGLDHGSIDTILKKPLRRQRMENWVAIEADFQNPDDVGEDIMIANFPRVIPSVVGTSFNLEETGNLNVSFQVNHNFVGPEGIKWGNLAFEHWGDPDTGINSAGISLNE